MERRGLLRAGLATAALLATSAHTPYRQWQVYRQRHLLIGTSKADAPTYALGQQIAEVLATHLPESSARVARGPDPWRLASLLTSGQLQVVLLSTSDVAALRDGRAPFEAFGATELRALFAFGPYYLVCRPDFPDHHAYLVVRTLTEHSGAIAGAEPVGGGAPVPVHPGAAAHANGAPMPPIPAGAERPAPTDHRH